MNRVKIFWVITKELPPMTAIEVKNAPPSLHFDGRMFFASVSFSIKVEQNFFVVIFQYLPRKQLQLDLSSLTPIFPLQILSPGKPSKDPLYGSGKI